MKARLPACFAPCLLAAFLSSVCACSSLPFTGLRFTSIHGVKVIEAKDEFEGQLVTFYLFFFDTFQRSLSEDVQVTMFMIDHPGMPRHKLGMSSSNSRALKPAPLRVSADGKEFILPISTWKTEKHYQRRRGQVPEKWTLNEDATYAIPDELRSSLLAASRIEIGIKKKMRAINDKDLRDVKALLAADSFAPDDPGK